MSGFAVLTCTYCYRVPCTCYVPGPMRYIDHSRVVIVRVVPDPPEPALGVAGEQKP